jgi:hypothetical protein
VRRCELQGSWGRCSRGWLVTRARGGASSPRRRQWRGDGWVTRERRGRQWRFIGAGEHAGEATLLHEEKGGKEGGPTAVGRVQHLAGGRCDRGTTVAHGCTTCGTGCYPRGIRSGAGCGGRARASWLSRRSEGARTSRHGGSSVWQCGCGCVLWSADTTTQRDVIGLHFITHV